MKVRQTTWEFKIIIIIIIHVITNMIYFLNNPLMMDF